MGDGDDNDDHDDDDDARGLKPVRHNNDGIRQKSKDKRRRNK